MTSPGAVTYVPTQWADSPATTSPIVAARLNNIENGITAATGQANAAVSAAASAAQSAAAAAVGAFPSYAPTGSAHRYQPERNAYNYRASNTRRLHAGRGRAMAGLDAAEVCIGDSLTAGMTNAATLATDRTHAWPRRYSDFLATLGVPQSGTGIVRTLDGIVGITDPRWAYTGTWSNGVTFTYSAQTGNTATFTSDKAGTAVAVIYNQGPGAGGFTVSVGGASTGPGFTTVANNTGSGPTWQRLVLSGLTVPVGGTVTIVPTSAAVTPIYGVEVFTPGALAVHNLGLSSSKASGAGTSSWSDLSNANQNLAIASSSIYQTTPYVVWCCLGVNDLNGGAAPAAVVSALTTIRSAFPNSDFVLVAASQFTTVTVAQWQAYVAALYALADSLDCPLFDLQDRYGGYASLAALGLAGDAYGHLASSGYADWGRLLGHATAA